MFTFGSDPEFFLTQKGSLKSAITFLPNKDFSIKKDGFSFYYDNVMAEAQIPPAKSKEEAVHNIGKCLQELSNLVKPCQILLQSSCNFSYTELKDPAARVAGCDPEMCAYKLEQISPPSDIIAHTAFRTAGGHIHLGNDMLFENSFQILNLVRMLDLFLGVPSVLIDNDKTAVSRRKIYGHAGSHRIPSHGVEYRTLSNFWLSSPKLVEMVYEICEFTIDFVKHEKHQKYWTLDEDLLDDDDPTLAHICTGYDVNALRQCINHCNRKLAEKFMLIVSNHLPKNILNNINIYSNKKFDLYNEWKIE